jgi:hypothetical protein
MQIGLRANEGWRAVWARLATAVRLAQLIGLDRSTSSASVYTREMSRRVWYSLCVLEIQAGLDGGFFSGSISNAPLGPCPLHVEDSDLSPESDVEPTQLLSFCDMTLPLMTYSMSRLVRRLTYVHVDDNGHPFSVQTWSERLSLVHGTAQELQKYLVHCDDSIAFQDFAQAVGDGMLMTMQLLARRPVHRYLGTRPAPEQEPSVLELSLDVLEQGTRKFSTSKFGAWKWFAWSKWYAVAILLSELCQYTCGPLYDRARTASERAFAIYKQSELPGPLLTAMERLKHKADLSRPSSTGTNEFALADGAETKEHSSSSEQSLYEPSSFATLPETYAMISWDSFLVDATNNDYLDFAA